MTPAARTVSSDELAQLKDVSRRVFGQEPGFVAAYLYGSAARGEPAGDIDVALLFREPPSNRQLEALAARLQAEGAPRGLQVDVRPLAGTSPRFRFNVLKDGQLLCEADPPERIRFEARAMSEWLDFQPVWNRMRQRMLDRWTHG